MNTRLSNFFTLCPRMQAWKAHSHLHAPRPQSSPLFASRHDIIKGLHRAAISFNRLLAWSMIALPVVAMLVGWGWFDSLPWVMGLVAAHGLLSLALFGGPRLKAASSPDVAKTLRAWLLGWAPWGASARERFMVGSWAIVLCIAWPVLIVWGSIAAESIRLHELLKPLFIAPVVGVLYLWVMAFMLRYPFAVGAHVARASNYALRRWGWRKAADEEWGVLQAVAYVVAQVVHLFSHP
jgi:hypothetical protein